MKSFKPLSILKRRKCFQSFPPEGKKIMLLIHFSTHAHSCRGCWDDSVSGSTSKLRQWSPGCCKILCRGVSVVSPSIFKQNFVYFSVVTSLQRPWRGTVDAHSSVLLLRCRVNLSCRCTSSAGWCIARCCRGCGRLWQGPWTTSSQALHPDVSDDFFSPQTPKVWCKNLTLNKAAHAVNFIRNWKRALSASQETVCIPHCLGFNAHERKIEGNGPWRFRERQFTLVQA